MIRRPADPQTGCIELRGARLRYDMAGDGPPLLMLMGLGVPGRGWSPQIPALSAHFRTLTVDQRGTGESCDWGRPLTIFDLARDAVELLDRLGIARAHLLGMSMGGMVSLEIAGRWPERVDRLVICCAPVRADRRIRRSTLALSSRSAAAFLRAGGGAAGLVAARERLKADWIPAVFSDRLDEGQAREVRTLMAALDDPRAGRGLVAQSCAVLRHDARRWAARIRAETLVVGGTLDRMISMEAVCRTAQAIRGSRLVFLEGAPHGLNHCPRGGVQRTPH